MHADTVGEQRRSWWLGFFADDTKDRTRLCTGAWSRGARRDAQQCHHDRRDSPGRRSGETLPPAPDQAPPRAARPPLVGIVTRSDLLQLLARRAPHRRSAPMTARCRRACSTTSRPSPGRICPTRTSSSRTARCICSASCRTRTSARRCASPPRACPGEERRGPSGHRAPYSGVMERKEDPLALPRCCASLLHGPDRSLAGPCGLPRRR